jgi:hypothetical protein
MGRFARSAVTELYTNPKLVRRIVRRHNFGRAGFEIDDENPAQRRKVGNIVYFI